MIPDRLQYFLDAFWNFEKSTKSGPSDPVFIITKILSTNTRKVREHHWTYYFHICEYEITKTWKVDVPHVWVCYFGFWNYEIWNVENLKIEIWNVDFLKYEHCKNGHGHVILNTCPTYTFPNLEFPKKWQCPTWTC